MRNERRCDTDDLRYIMNVIKTLTKSLREFKKETILSPVLVSLEVVVECLIPLYMVTMLERIQEDNSIEFSLGETDSYTAVTQTAANAWNVSSLPQFQQAGFSGNVYLGIIANTPRLEMARQYCAYVLSQTFEEPE